MKNVAFTSIGVLCLSLSAAAACPWASGQYRATVPPDITIDFAFDAQCSAVTVIDSGGAPQVVKTQASNNGWTVKFGTTTVLFDTKGKRAKGSRGGATRTLRLKKL